MALLPPCTNADYRGAPASAWFLALVAITTIIPGVIHYFLPDGGAGVIGGLDLSTRADTIIAIFAWYGAMQIPYGVALLIVALRYRPLAPLFLLLTVVQQGLGAFTAWFWKGAHSGHHPPEHYVSVIATALALVFLVLSLRPSRPPAR